ncbi:unnamed protein product [Ceutorhynchus assimilis]|uniref:Suppressor of white apricot N-terminal domain-containing protein n=1 Tax=Ceutorhynchus assimilis TaxID=467358 RepID=A0A9P0DK46_9CUCU|nr:unnamed protein product [Ceutorhynchus assimilis]
MWHEARRQERKIRGMLVDYRKRAERRRDFYERIKADPTQFLQIHGRQCKIHLDPVIAAAADSAVMMPWQGNENNLIDRFDVRAHLDYIPPVKKDEDSETTQEERYLNYERYRIIAQNAYLSISEEKFLKQLHLEEQFGYTETKTKKESKGTGAAIGFNYEDGTAIGAPLPAPDSPEDNYEDGNSDSDLDVDLAINVSKIDPTQAHEMNKHGQHFGMAGNDFYSFLTNDLEEAESFKLAKEEEHEKALYSGRKSRRERRAHREKRLANRKISPPSYAAKESPSNPSLRDESKSPSRSPSPSPDAGKITYITSFGDDEETPSSSKPTYADKVKYGKPKKTVHNNLVHFDKPSRSISVDRKSSTGRKRSRSSSRSRTSKTRSHKNTQSRSRSPHSKRRRSKSRSRSSYRSRSRSYRIEKNSRSRSRSNRIEKSSRSRSLSVKARKGRSRSRSKRTRSSRSRSRSRKSRSRSRQRPLRRSVSSSSLSTSSSSSISSSSGKSRSKSPMGKSKSRSPVAPAPPIIRYYGRKKSDMSSSESDTSEDDGDYGTKSEHAGSSDSNHRYGNNSGTGTKVSKNHKNYTIYNSAFNVSGL